MGSAVSDYGNFFAWFLSKMGYKEKADVGQNLQDPMFTRIPATAQPDLTRNKDTAIRGEKRSVFLKTHISMSDISTPFPTWKYQHLHIVFINLATFLSVL